jgi:Tol biopolymer transport system component
MVSPASGLTANLSNDPATSGTAPAWSPDGTLLAFARGGDQDGGLPSTSTPSPWPAAGPPT